MILSPLYAAQIALTQQMIHRGNAFYPRYHLAPPAGRMGIPNSLIWFEDRYHLFYQHNPLSAEPGRMYWGHATSTDLLRWFHEPLALAPDTEADGGGCASGCAVNDNGKLSLIYTGQHTAQYEDTTGQSLCLATSEDGVRFEKQGVILSPPAGISEFRDPEVCSHGDQWWMVVNGLSEEKTEQSLIYRGNSLSEWTLAGSTVSVRDPIKGYADHFIEKQRLLLTAPGEGIDPVTQDRLKRPPIRSTETLHSVQGMPSAAREPNFSAPLSCLAPDGRRILIASMLSPGPGVPMLSQGWAGYMSLPRELTESGGKYLQQPVREVINLRRQTESLPSGRLRESRIIHDNALAIEAELCWDTGHTTAEIYGLQLGSGARLLIDQQAGWLTLHRCYPDVDLDDQQRIRLPAGARISLRIFIDVSSLEVFVNDSGQVLSGRIYPRANDRQLSLYAAQGEASLLRGELSELS
ncbi:glycoside hydrolase family 32 protein [Tatumella terrea]|uniref:glycoside hydrolase family 32 protein n=1 Tax=Tatumella terrea TaxID=419007 RepID=UPI0031DC3D3B